MTIRSHQLLRVFTGAAHQPRFRDLGSKDELSVFIEAVADYAIYLVDLEGRIASWNTGAERLTGFTSDEVLGKPFTTLYTPQDRVSGRADDVRRVAEAAGRHEADGWRVRKDGTRFWAHVVMTAVRDDRGRLMGFAKVMHDLTERSRIDDHREQLLSWEQRARAQVTTILESITEGFMAVDHEWRFTYVNRRGRELVHALRPGNIGDLIGQDIWEVMPELRGTAFEALHRRAMAEQEPLALEEYFPPWDRWLEVRDYPSSDGLSIYFADITERKRGEQEREALLARERAARSEAERISESRSRLMRGFSHDLKNPLGAADGYAAMLEDGITGQLDPEQQESIRRMRRSIKYSLRLIDDLLEFARAEAGEIELKPAKIDASALARDVAEEFRAQLVSAGLELNVQVAAPALLESDPARVRQILSNLISNAAKYTTQGNVTVTVAALTDTDPSRPGEWAAISVADTGDGIPEDQRDRIFQEFTRLDPTAQQGAGVGLAISRRIARLLGGDITVEANAPHGSRFTFWLPCGMRPRTDRSSAELQHDD